MAKNKDKFNFFIPAKFEKGGKDGKTMYIKGIASSEVEDTDGETLVPAGYDIAPLLSSGFLNYNHQGSKDPNAIIGQPTKAEIINNGKDLYIEGYLYPSSKAAQKTYELAETLERDSPDRRMGFSIEGKALEKDPLNPKRITRARITGVAITPCPKNPNTLMSIVKGEYSDAFIKPSLDVNPLVNEYNEWFEGDKISKHYGEVESVEDFLRHNYEDDLDILDELVKAITAQAGEGVVQTESVDGGKKEFDKLLRDKNISPDAKLKKSQIYSLILSKYSEYFENDINKAKEVYNLVKEYNNFKGMENTNTDDILTKAVANAFSFIDSEIQKIKKSEDDDKEVDEKVEEKEEEVIKKEKTSKKTDKDDDDEEEDKDEEKVEKSYKEELGVQNAEIDNSKTYGGIDVYLKNVVKSALSKGQSSGDIVKDLISKGCEETFALDLVKSCVTEMNNLKANGGITKDGVDVEKKEVPESTHSKLAPDNKFNKSEEEELNKGELNIDVVSGIEDRFKALATILKSQSDNLQGVLETNKSLKEENNTLKKSLTDITERLDNYGSQSQGVRSVTNAHAVERFKGDINKSEDGRTNYSLSSHSHVQNLTNKLSNAFEKSVSGGNRDHNLEKAILQLSISKGIDDDVVRAIEPTLQDLNINITK